jgi:hypothetical protein
VNDDQHHVDSRVKARLLGARTELAVRQKLAQDPDTRIKPNEDKPLNWSIRNRDRLS